MLIKFRNFKLNESKITTHHNGDLMFSDIGDDESCSDIILEALDIIEIYMFENVDINVSNNYIEMIDKNSVVDRFSLDDIEVEYLEYIKISVDLKSEKQIEMLISYSDIGIFDETSMTFSSQKDLETLVKTKLTQEMKERIEEINIEIESKRFGL